MSVIGKGMTALVAAATLATVAAPAEARRWRHHRDNDDAALAIGAGIVGLGLVAALASSRRHYGYDPYYDRGYYGGYYGGYRYRPRYYYYDYDYYRPRHYGYGYGYKHHRRWRDRDWDDHRWRGKRGWKRHYKHRRWRDDD